MDPMNSASGYNPVDPKQIERADVDKRYTGYSDEDGLRYTGSSTDYILTYLRLRNEDPNLDDVVKERNKAAAESILSARLAMDKASGEVVVTLKIQEGPYLKTYLMVGGLDEEGRVTELRASKQNPEGVAMGSQCIQGKLKCLDANQKTCETAFARLLIGDVPGERAAVAIVFRQSLADYRVSFTKTPEDSFEQNPEYEFIRAFWKNTNEDINTHHRLKNIYMNSFEIVNGRSGFDVQVLGRARQLLSFGGPLLAPEAGSAVSITADRTPQLIESTDLESLNSYNYEMADFISKATIVNNNGLGQVRLNVKLRKRGGYEPDSFKLTLMRIIKPTVEPNEENLRLD